MPRTRRPREIFLSHSSADGRAARRIAEALRTAGLQVWFAPTHLRGAQAWHDEIGRALKRCDAFLLLLTPSAVKSPWVRRELVFALSQRRYEGRILPVKLKHCDVTRLSWVLQTIEYLDCSREPRSVAEQVLKVW